MCSSVDCATVYKIVRWNYFCRNLKWVNAKIVVGSSLGLILKMYREGLGLL